MAQQSVLYPRGPLLIVDKGMRKKKGSRAYDSQIFVGSDRDIKVSVLGNRNNTGQSTVDNAEPVRSKGQARNFRFVAHAGGKKRPSKRQSQPNTSKHGNLVTLEGSKESSNPSTSTSHNRPTEASTYSSDVPPVLQIIPRSSSPFYGRHNDAGPLVSEVLPFYGDMTYFFYPLQTHLPLKFDPITTIYLPASFRDVCMLNAVVTSTAYRLQGKMGWHLNHGAVFFHTAIREMQRRIKTGDITDTVLLAVTCFIYRDYCQGQASDSQTHIDGMLRMLDVRGGIGNVVPGFRQKIYRSLLGPAVDFISKPRWPRLERDTPTLYSTLVPEQSSNSSQIEPLLQHANLDTTLSDIMLQVHQLSQAINYGIDHTIPVDPFALDQDILNIQHDLLSLDDVVSASLDTACRLAALVFTRLLTRERPLAVLNSETLPTAMTELLGRIPALPQTATLRMWCFFMGALAAQQTDKRLLLLNDLRKSCKMLRITTWKAAQVHLRRVAWITAALELDGHMLWQQLTLEPQPRLDLS